MSDKRINEEVAANCVGGGKIAGMGIGPQGEPAAKKPNKKKKRIDSYMQFTMRQGNAK